MATTSPTRTGRSWNGAVATADRVAHPAYIASFPCPEQRCRFDIEWTGKIPGATTRALTRGLFGHVGPKVDGAHYRNGVVHLLIGDVDGGARILRDLGFRVYEVSP